MSNPQRNEHRRKERLVVKLAIFINDISKHYGNELSDAKLDELHYSFMEHNEEYLRKMLDDSIQFSYIMYQFQNLSCNRDLYNYTPIRKEAA